MQFVKKKFSDTLEVKQSKFIAYLVPFSQYKSVLEQLKVNHPKARHFVIAYRYLNEYEQIVEYSTDDGEPNGTSGKPSLMVLQGQSIINTTVIVVRYFGGTKLGTGGLVRAYSDAVNLVLSKAKLIEYEKEIFKYIVMKYSYVRLVDYECELFSINILEKQFDIEVKYHIQATKENINKFLSKVDRLVKVVEQ